MKEIVVLSGKGGTGKTSWTAAWSVLAGAEVVVADCDVDAADLHLLLAPDFACAEAFHAGELASIDPDRCGACGRCAEVCRFGAVATEDGAYAIDPLACEGCGYCARVCPDGAIADAPRLVGSWYRSTARTGAVMVHARLEPGGENSGKLVAQVKREARREAEAGGRAAVLVDGAPGIGCPVVSSLSGASLAVLVTEPSLSGLHDLKRVHGLAASFGIPTACVLNKSDLNDSVRRELLDWLDDVGTPLLAEVPYHAGFVAAITAGETFAERDADLRDAAVRAWDGIRRLTGLAAPEGASS